MFYGSARGQPPTCFKALTNSTGFAYPVKIGDKISGASKGG